MKLWDYTSYCYLFVLIYSPSARLVQIEKAQEAIVAGSPSVAITTQNEVIVATEKKQTDDVQKLQKFYNDKTCVLYSGVSADYK